jgi:hypothetical protein
MKIPHLSAVVLPAVAFLSLGTLVRAQGTSTRFDAALKAKIIRENQRHFPKVTVRGNEVRLTYSIEIEWSKGPQWDDSAKGLALECLETDYAALKADPRHRLHDYFHVIEYSTWAHQVIGEATLMRADYPSAAAVDAAERSPLK